MDWKIVGIDGYPENNGNGESDIVIGVDLNRYSILTRRSFADDEDGKDCSYWQDVPKHQQHRIVIWAYLPEPPESVFDQVIQKMKDDYAKCFSEEDNKNLDRFYTILRKCTNDDSTIDNIDTLIDIADKINQTGGSESKKIIKRELEQLIRSSLIHHKQETSDFVLKKLERFL